MRAKWFAKNHMAKLLAIALPGIIAASILLALPSSAAPKSE